MEKKDNVLIIRPDLAQYLLDRGYHIVAIAKNRFDPVRTVFYFKPADGLKKDVYFFLERVIEKQGEKTDDSKENTRA